MNTTLQDFLTLTKGVSYIVSAVILVCFIPFWLFLTEREKKR
jgi:hypothetical protein